MREWCLERSSIKKGECLAFLILIIGLNCPWKILGFIIVAFAIAFWLWVMTATN